jgi:hypothetical protein
MTSPPALESSIAAFSENNPGVTVSPDGDTVIIDNLWAQRGLIFRISTAAPADAATQDALQNITLNPSFDALFHRDSDYSEILCPLVQPDDEAWLPIIERAFTLSFESASFRCAFAPPSDRLMALARLFERSEALEEPKAAFQLEGYKHWQNANDFREPLREFFQRMRAVAFQVHGVSQCNDIHRLFSHINRMMRYYDRRSPTIVIRQPDKDDAVQHVPHLRYITGGFPTNISCRLLDDIPLRLLEAAEREPARIAFLYYYQVIEYAGYYYAEEKVRSHIRRILRDPAAADSTDEHIADIYEIVHKHQLQDDAKMKGAMEQSVDYRRVWKEIQHDLLFFSTPVQFDGGFTSAALASPDMSEEAFAKNWVQSVFSVLTHLRNAIAHAREKRQGHCVLPTSKNSAQIRRYLPIVRRVAEELTFKG